MNKKIHYSLNTEFQKGKHYSVETEFKKGEHSSPQTEFKKGQIPWNKGMKWSKIIKTKMSLARKGRKFPNTSKTMKCLWKNKEYKDKQIKSIFKGWLKTPNKPERQLQALLNKLFPKCYNFVGDGKILFRGLNPDFIDYKHKKIIELFGVFWHKKPKIAKRDIKRRRIYRNYGYKMLVIWDYQLKNISKTIIRLKKFHQK